MPTQAEIAQHREAIAALAALARSDLAAGLRGVDPQDAARVAAVLRDLLPVLVATYTPAVSTVAADFYDVLRLDAEVEAAFAAAVLAPPAAADLQESIGGWLTPLFAAGAASAAATLTSETVATTLDTIVDTLVAATDQQTVEANVAADPAAPHYARHASVGACAFCAMLAQRGPDYVSEESATRVVIGRGKRRLGEKYHPNCHCTAVPVWDKATYEEAPYVAQWRKAYTDATRAVRGAEKPTQAVLAHMRETLGTN